MMTFTVYALTAIGLCLVIAARFLDGSYPLAMAGVICWMIAFGVLLSRAGPHARR
jgi:hypothetical protein